MQRSTRDKHVQFCSRFVAAVATARTQILQTKTRISSRPSMLPMVFFVIFLLRTSAICSVSCMFNALIQYVTFLVGCWLSRMRANHCFVSFKVRIHLSGSNAIPFERLDLDSLLAYGSRPNKKRAGAVFVDSYVVVVVLIVTCLTEKSGFYMNPIMWCVCAIFGSWCPN